MNWPRVFGIRVPRNAGHRTRFEVDDNRVATYNALAASTRAKMSGVSACD